MKLYRITGRAERWPGTGKLIINPMIFTSITKARKVGASHIANFEKRNRAMDIVLEELQTGILTLERVAEALRTEDTEHLIESRKKLDKWSVAHDPEKKVDESNTKTDS
jgi:hypothetical protein